VLALFLFCDLPVRALLSALVSAIPDLDVLDTLLPGTKHRRWFPSHWQKFPHGQADPLLGIATQLIVAVGSILLLIFWGC
jgi:hypothetical protein